MTTTTTRDVEIELYQRDARHYISMARRPAVTEVKDAISDALRDCTAVQTRITVNVPRDLAERFCRVSSRPFRLPVAQESLQITLRRALADQPRNEDDIEPDFDDEIADEPINEEQRTQLNDEDVTMEDIVGPEPGDTTDEIETAEHEQADETNVQGDDAVPFSNESDGSSDLANGDDETVQSFADPADEVVADAPTDEQIANDENRPWSEREAALNRLGGMDADDETVGVGRVEVNGETYDGVIPTSAAVESLERIENPGGSSMPLDPRSDAEREVDEARGE